MLIVLNTYGFILAKVKLTDVVFSLINFYDQELQKSRPQLEKMEETASMMRENINSMSTALRESNDAKWEAEAKLRKEKEQVEKLNKELQAHQRTAADLRQQVNKV